MLNVSPAGGHRADLADPPVDPLASSGLAKLMRDVEGDRGGNMNIPSALGT